MMTQNMGSLSGLYGVGEQVVRSSQKLSSQTIFNVALIIDGAQLLLDKHENAAQSVGLIMNCSYATFMTLNIPEEETSLVCSTVNQLEKVKPFVYLSA